MNVRADRFLLLDSLRGFGALGVLVAHTTWFAGGLQADAWTRPYADRIEGVIPMFFVISGFLLYRPFAKARLLQSAPLSVRAYGWRRIIRIVPGFWVALVVIAIWLGTPDIWTPREILRNFGFLQLYYGGGIHDVIPQAWTLSVEAVFYAALPLWVVAMRRWQGPSFRARLRQELRALTVLMAVALAYAVGLAFVLKPDSDLAPIALLGIPPGSMLHFALGMLLAVISVWDDAEDRAEPPQPLRFLARHPAVCWLIALGTVLLGASQLGLTPELGETATPAQLIGRHLLNTVFAVVVVIPAVFGPPREGLTRRILASRPLLFIGLISYSFYLWHWAVLQQLFRWKLDGTIGFLDNAVAWFVAGGIGAAILGTLGFYLVERPAMSLKRLVPLRQPDTREEALVEPTSATPVTPTRAS